MDTIQSLWAGKRPHFLGQEALRDRGHFDPWVAMVQCLYYIPPVRPEGTLMSTNIIIMEGHQRPISM